MVHVWIYAGSRPFGFCVFGSGTISEDHVRKQIALLVDGDIEEGNESVTRTWLARHTVRTLLVDVPALLCFAEVLLCASGSSEPRGTAVFT
jgi:hypothetical protein